MFKEIKDFIKDPEVKVNVNIDIHDVTMMCVGAVVGILIGISGGRKKTSVRVIVIK